MKTLLTFLLFTLCLSASNFTGKWTGTFESAPGENGSAMLVLTHEGSKLTGTGGPDADNQWPITNGKVDGDTLTFDVAHEDHTLHITLKYVGDHLKGEAKGEDNGEPHTAALDLKRAE